MAKEKIKFKPSEIESARVKAQAKKSPIDFGELRDWTPNSSALLALIFGIINVGTASGFILNKAAGEIYSAFLVLALFTLVLMSIPMTVIFSIGAILKYLKSYRSSKAIQDVFWLAISVLSLLSVIIVLTKGLNMVSGL